MLTFQAREGFSDVGHTYERTTQLKITTERERGMRTNLSIAIVLVFCLAASPTLALNPDNELWVPAAARGFGAGTASWITDLYILNPGDEAVTVEIAWLERDQDNTDPLAEVFEIAAGETLVLEDLIETVFGLEEGAGGFHIEILQDGDEGGEKSVSKQGSAEDAQLVVEARVYSLDDQGGTFGLGFEGVPSYAAISSNDPETTHSIGVTNNSAYRSNWYGLNIGDEQAEVMVELLDLDGDVMAAETFELPPMAPILKTVSGLGGPSFANGTLRFTMLDGEGIFGVTKIDRTSNDAIHLESHWQCSADSADLEFTDEFSTGDCTFANTGRNPFFIPLDPGYQFYYEGVEDGQEIVLRITVLDDTETVDGVETRVFEEYETAEDEVIEISRNYFAICVETGSVFYFGEDVDIYENSEIVGHEGAWRAGEDGASAGILMPGTVLVGSRYYQEVAPGVAVDQAEHMTMQATVETPVDTFEGCLTVRETTNLEPGAVSFKYYAPDVGLVRDNVLDLVEIVEQAR
jgi:hypothetical protein